MPRHGPTKAARAETLAWVCPACTHRIVRTRTRDGQVLDLDTTLVSYVVTGLESKDGYPLAAPSRGYLPHAVLCRERGLDIERE